MKRPRKKRQTVDNAEARPEARRSLGQNFLIHAGTARSIIRRSGVKEGDQVVELGTGLGALTLELAKVASRVIGIEIDERLIGLLRKDGALPPHVELRHENMLDTSFIRLAQELGSPVKIIGNLPYNISSQIVFRLLEQREHIEWATLMFQKEVAERLLAGPGSKNYGILSVLTAYCADATRIMDIPPTLFRPRPKVTSTVVKLEFKPPALPAEDFRFFSTVVKKAFQQRRKKLSNALKGLCGAGRKELSTALDATGISPSARAEQLTVEDFVSLANRLHGIKLDIDLLPGPSVKSA